MEISNNIKQDNFKTLTMYHSGLPTKYFNEGDGLNVTINKEERTVLLKREAKLLTKESPDIILGFDQIMGAGEITQKQLKEGSIIGRAVVGGILFGGIGALVGGMSGTKKKIKNKKFFAISYKSTNGDDRTILFKYFPASCSKLQEKINEIVSSPANEDLDGSIYL